MARNCASASPSPTSHRRWAFPWPAITMRAAEHGVLDPLFVKAMVIESGGQRAAVVALDIISVTRAITDQAVLPSSKRPGFRAVTC